MGSVTHEFRRIIYNAFTKSIPRAQPDPRRHLNKHAPIFDLGRRLAVIIFLEFALHPESEWLLPLTLFF
jgi:hypothetical protein